jgi:hypothetical protein
MLAIVMTKNSIFHAQSKHIELRHDFIKDMVSKKEMQLEFINTKINLQTFSQKLF